MISSLLVTFIFCIFNLITCDNLSFRLVRKHLKSQGSKKLLMDFRPAWGVELFNSRYDYFCFEPIVIFVFLDFVLYEYSSFSSSQEFFLHFGIWKNHSKPTHFSLILGTKNLVNIGTQHPCGTVYGSTNFLCVDNGDLTVRTVQYHKLWRSTALTPDVYKKPLGRMNKYPCGTSNRCGGTWVYNLLFPVIWKPIVSEKQPLCREYTPLWAVKSLLLI